MPVEGVDSANAASFLHVKTYALHANRSLNQGNNMSWGVREGYGGIYTITGYVDRSSLWDHLDTGEHRSATLLSLYITSPL